jgi:hypothetical protein
MMTVDNAACLDCGHPLSICEHAAQRLVDPMVGLMQGRVEELIAQLDEARALATDQQRLNEAMVASLKRGLEKLQASEAECARLRDDCAAMLKILDATYDGPLGRFTRDRIRQEIDVDPAGMDRGRAPAGEAADGEAG